MSAAVRYAGENTTYSGMHLPLSANFNKAPPPQTFFFIITRSITGITIDTAVWHQKLVHFMNERKRRIEVNHREGGSVECIVHKCVENPQVHRIDNLVTATLLSYGYAPV